MRRLALWQWDVEWDVELNSHIVLFPFWLSLLPMWFWGDQVSASCFTA